MIEIAPSISRCIRHIWFSLFDQVMIADGDAEPDPTWLGTAVFRGLDLRRLHSVGFRSTRSNETSRLAFLLDALAKFQTIRCITLYRCQEFGPFIPFICRFPMLDTLSIEESGFYPNEPELPKTPRLSQLSTLSLIGCPYDQVGLRSWFASAIEPQNLRSLTIDVLHNENVNATNELLKVLGHHLQSLDIKLPGRPPYVPDYRNQDEYSRWPRVREVYYFRRPSRFRTAFRETVMKDFTLRYNTGLRHLTLHTPDSPEFLFLFDQLNVGILRSLSIIVNVSSESEIKNKDYKALDHRLVQPDLQCLEEVRILSEGLLKEYDLRVKVQRVFPLVFARGLLRIEMVKRHHGSMQQTLREDDSIPDLS